jgi:alginate O-acetyltransferase complex protein AlgI
VLGTFGLLLVTWVFFRAENFSVAWRYLSVMFGQQPWQANQAITNALMTSRPALCSLAVGAAVVWLLPNSQRWLARLTAWKVAVCLTLCVWAIAVMFQQGYSPFLYFQF